MEVIALDDLCPVCHLLLYSPVKTTCAHVLCASCMAQWADTSHATHVMHSSLDLDLSSFDPSYVPSYNLEANCPMCRTPTSARPHPDLAMELERKYPSAYTERRIEEEVERGQRVGDSGIEGVMILIGNRHRLVRGEDSANKHDWTFFVRLSRPDIVKEIRVNLHPTFRPPCLVLRQPPFEVRRLGWGYFNIESHVVLHDGYTWVAGDTGRNRKELKLEWMLDFEERGRQERIRARVKQGVAEEDEMGDDESTMAMGLVSWPHTEDGNGE